MLKNSIKRSKSGNSVFNFYVATLPHKCSIIKYLKLFLEIHLDRKSAKIFINIYFSCKFSGNPEKSPDFKLCNKKITHNYAI